jgi:hypothetical protein
MGFTNGIFGVWGFAFYITFFLFFWKKREILLHWGLVAMGYPTREALVSITYLLSPLEGGMNGKPLSVCNKYCILLEIACEWVAPEEGPQYLPHGSKVVCFGTLLLCHTYMPSLDVESFFQCHTLLLVKL